MQSIEIPPGARPCLNCGKPLLGSHCYACGQPVKGLVRQFSSIVGDFLDSVFEYDSRTLNTIGPLLYRPGHLSTEYFAGRRVRYVSPVRLFVFLCLVSFFVLQFTVDTDVATVEREAGPFAEAQTADEVERRRTERDAALQAALQSITGEHGAQARERIERQRTRLHARADEHIEWLRLRDEALQAGLQPPPPPEAPGSAGQASIHFGGQAWDPQSNPVVLPHMPDAFNRWLNRQIGRAQVNIDKVQENPKLLLETFLQTLPQTFFVLLPLFALLLKFVYLFKRRLYMEHLIVALHSHAFLCLTLLLLIMLGGLRALLPAGLASSAISFIELALALWVPLYLLLMQKRVYRQGWIMTSLKYAFVGFCYMLLLSIGAAINLMTNLVTM
jgi:hypothetical protein